MPNGFFFIHFFFQKRGATIENKEGKETTIFYQFYHPPKTEANP